MSRRIPSALYLDEMDISAAVLGPGRLDEWRAHVPGWEQEGLPRIDPVTRRRYYPAVRAWFDRRHGLATTIPAPIPDGQEDWSCLPRSKPRGSSLGSEPTAPLARIGQRPQRS